VDDRLEPAAVVHLPSSSEDRADVDGGDACPWCDRVDLARRDRADHSAGVRVTHHRASRAAEETCARDRSHLGNVVGEEHPRRPGPTDHYRATRCNRQRSPRPHPEDPPQIPRTQSNTQNPRTTPTPTVLTVVGCRDRSRRDRAQYDQSASLELGPISFSSPAGDCGGGSVELPRTEQRRGEMSWRTCHIEWRHHATV